MQDLFQSEQPVASEGPYADVAIERGIDRSPTGLTYRVPAGLADLSPGERVVVPLGRGGKRATGYVIRVHEDEPGYDPKKIKAIVERASGGVSLPGELVELARWVANYYVCPLGMVFGAMLPAAVTRGTGMKRRQVVRRVETARGGDASDDRAAGVTKNQRRVLDAAERIGGWIAIKALADEASVKTTGPIKALVAKGLLASETREAVHSDLDLRARQDAHAKRPGKLSEGQQRALDRIAKEVDRFGVHVLHGVTGSGKTEVYLAAVEEALAAGRTAIILVPEIALTPQTVGRFLARFGPESVAVLHSGLTAAQRHAQWRRIDAGQTPIVVGARSAVFAPVKRLGLIVVDEEHDNSYKQDQLPRYHARDVAIKRAQAAGVPVVLGSATPSLESYFNALGVGPRVLGVGEQGNKPKPQHPTPNTHYRYHELPDRVPGMQLPKVEIVDLTEERRLRRGVHLLSRRLEQRLQQAIHGEKGGEKVSDTINKVSDTNRVGQAMLLLNRRGYANYIACPDHGCGWMMTCRHCDATMVYHKDKRLPLGGVVRCHHCLAEQALPQVCPESGHKVTTFGLGTQRVEEELARKFEGLRVARMDSDTMRRAEDYRDVLERFRAGEIDVLLGTQMIAKGLDFPGVRLVGVISADTSLNMPDFRAAERTFQLISQVAGRSGRSERVGRVVLQSFSPESPPVALAARHDYAGFARMELQTRVEMGLPPAGRMVRIVLRDTDHVKALARATDLARNLRAGDDALQLGVHLRGPFPCPIARVADHHRYEVQLLAKSASPLQRLMTELRNRGKLISDQHTAVDVDPVSLL
ncbi:MAG: replication restart helicase PriA [Phycisphaeraceae bacterium]